VIQYGWTSDRVVAAAFLLVASSYAIGYLWAAYQYDTWLRPVAMVNVFTSLLILAVLLALFTPLADPARIGVQSQMARLAKGKITAARFDFRYLRAEGGRYGQAALEQLKQATGPDAALLQQGATEALAINVQDRRQATQRSTAPASVLNNVTVWPAGAQLPASFLTQKWEATPDNRKPDCLTSKEGKCDAFILDLSGDGKQQVVLLDKPNNVGDGRLFVLGADGSWSVAAFMGFQDAACKPLMEKLRKGEFTITEPLYKDLNIGGRRVKFEPVAGPEEECSKLK